MKEKVIVIVGPTAVGKTRLSIELAKRFCGEIINGDAMQVYCGLNIGTAKISAEEAQGIPHHLIDIRRPEEPYTVAEFQTDARRKISELSDRGKLPVLVGGTGLYIKAALFDYKFSTVGEDASLRTALSQFARREGAAALHARLKKVDPVSAERIHPHNVKRVIRALEVCCRTGRPFSQMQERTGDRPLFDAMIIGLTMDRPLLYRRIDERVERMIETGLVDEARRLYDCGIRSGQAVQAIGYKEFFPYFDGLITLDRAIETLKKNSRHYAKRQFTWFRRQMDVQWFDMTDSLVHFSKKAEEIAAFVSERLADSENR